MKFAVKGAAVVALLATLASPAHGWGVREYRMPPIGEPVCGDPDGGNGFAMGELGPERTPIMKRPAFIWTIGIFGLQIFAVPESLESSTRLK